MKLAKRISQQRERRAFRVRNRARQTGRHRLTVFRSNKHIYAQIVDDVAGRTLVSASTIESELGGTGRTGGNKAAADRIGTAIGQRAVAAGIKAVAFDRGSYKYHGRVAALADAARKAGLEF
jgi:large subunit ribosomal protein L18